MKNNKKDILLCCNSDIGRGNTIGFRFGKIAERLLGNNINFEIIARANYSNLKVETPFYKNYLARSLNALRIYVITNLNFRPFDINCFDNFVLRKLKKSGQKYKLAHIGEYLPKTIYFLKKQKTKILLDIPIAHYRYVLYLKEKGFKQDEKIKRIKELDDSIKQADLLIVPSLFVKQTLEMAGFDKPMRIISFGADIKENFSEKDIEKRKEEKMVRFIFAGSVNFRKGINFLLEAWQKLKLENSQLLICGRVHKSIWKELKNYNLKNVKFCGFVNMEKYYRKGDVFVFPTLFEGSAKVVYEAMSYGLPVITTFNAGSIVEDGRNGFIVPIGDIDELAEKMLYFYKNRSEIVKMGKNALDEVKDYTWDFYGQKIIKIYRQVWEN